jgi:hypothetical protein
MEDTMNTTMIEQQQGPGADRAQRRIGRLAGAALALVAISGGLGGALAQHEFPGSKPAVTVVHENGGFGAGAVNPAGPTSQCAPSYPGTRVVLLEARFSTSPCTNPPMLVGDRVSARSAL